MKNNKGIALIALICLITVITSVVVGITISTASNLRFTTFYTQKLQALAAAEAGVAAAIADYKMDNYWAKVTIVKNISGGEFYKVGTDANFLLVDATSTAVGGSTVAFGISNINDSQSITIDTMSATWTNAVKTLRDIRIDGTSVWNGTVTSGTPVTLSGTARTLAAKCNPKSAQLTFNGNMSGDTISVAFGFNGPPASSREATVLNAGQPTTKSFSVTSTGSIGNYKRTVEIVCCV